MKNNCFNRRYVILFVCFSALCVSALLSEVRAQNPSAAARQTVNRINRIEELPIKKGEPATDKYAAAIVELGEAAAPYLIEKLTDRRNSRVAYLYQYKIGDVARALLDIIYDYPEFPFPDGAKSLPAKYGDYRDYTEFFSRSRNRKQLRKSWREFVKKRNADQAGK